MEARTKPPLTESGGACTAGIIALKFEKASLVEAPLGGGVLGIHGIEVGLGARSKLFEVGDVWEWRSRCSQGGGGER